MERRTVIAFLAGLSVCAIALAIWHGGTTQARSLQPAAASDVLDGSIAPGDFVIIPCPTTSAELPCLIVAAGGKRVLIGAPSGIGSGVLPGEERMPDGVLLLSLRAHGLEGLDEIRNRAWEAGSQAPLTIIGEAGIESIVDGLNAAFTVPDALAYAEGRRTGGFALTPLSAKPVKPGEVAFDTGDLRILALRGGPGRLAVYILYDEWRVLLADCGARAGDIEAWPAADFYIGCGLDEYPAERLGGWPVTGSLRFGAE